MPKLSRKQQSVYSVGDYWLEQRKQSPYWQITRYDPKTRSYIYRSTLRECLDDAKSELDAFHAGQQALKAQPDTSTAQILPILKVYWDEHASQVIAAEQAAQSIRAFIGFLLQDPIGPSAVLTDLTPILFERFRKWRMAEHSYSVPWGGRTYTVNSKGVTGGTVQRNIHDIRAAINHAHVNQRIPTPPKIKQVPKRYIGDHKDRVLTRDEMAQIFWYASHDKDMFRFVALQMMTSVRPMAAGQFDPNTQYDHRSQIIDLQPKDGIRTAKRNALIPAARPLRPILLEWRQAGVRPVRSHRTAWRTMRRVLKLSEDVKAKTIRYTVATWLYETDWVPERQISEMLGHTDTSQLARTSRIYARYRPENMGLVVKGLEEIWLDISRRARRYAAGHLLVTDKFGEKSVARKTLEFQGF